MTRNLKLLISFVWKFLGTVRFGNDHVAAILDLEVAFRRNTCFVKNLEGVDLLKGNQTTNLYTINLHEIASASPIFLMARATSTKSWLWHQRLSHLNFDTINDLAKNDLIIGLLKFKYHKEHICLSCEQGKSKKASHKPKHVPNSKQRSKDEAPKEIKTFLKKITVLLQALQLLLRATLKTAPSFTDDLTKHRASSLMAENHISPFLHVFGSLCYPKNNREDIGNLGTKGDIGFFIGYSANSYAYRVYNQRTKIIETMNVTFDELSAMAFEQHSSKPVIQSMTS
ncbi:retrovirus-related pol polyprotein from transposon TNT 1-94 [Tanacetum coccineum]